MAKRGRPKLTKNQKPKTNNKKQKASKNTPVGTGFRPAPGYVMVRAIEREQKTQAGIYLPDSAKEDKPMTGEVVLVGDNEINDHGIERKSPVKVGNKVVYKKWGGNEVKLEDQEFVFIKFDDILAIEN